MPGSQFVQIVAPSDDIVPASQLVHDDGSSALGMVPAGQAVHVAAPSLLTLPAAHDAQLDDALSRANVDVSRLSKEAAAQRARAKDIIGRKDAELASINDETSRIVAAHQDLMDAVAQKMTDLGVPTQCMKSKFRGAFDPHAVGMVSARLVS